MRSRAVLDPNVLISALLSPTGAPAALLRRWLDGEFDLVVSEQLIDELSRAFAYPKLRARVSQEEADALIGLLRAGATVLADPPSASVRSRDPGDDYLLALAAASRAILVTGDSDLVALKDLPIETPAAFLARLG